MNSAENKFMTEALAMARKSVLEGGFPAGAIITIDDRIVGTGISVGNKINDPTSHGEMEAIKSACTSIKSTDLSRATLYTSMEPCLMCFSASMWASISRIFFAVRKEIVSAEYYGGNYQIASINNDFLRPIALIHAHEYEEAALIEIRNWEKNQAA